MMTSMKVSVVLGLAACLAFVGCGSDDTNATTSTSSSSASSGAGGSGGGGAGGAGGGSCTEIPMCVSCNAVLTMGADATKLCTCNGPPSSADLFGPFGGCVCNAKCSTECGMNACLGKMPTMACQACADANCATEQSACAADM